MDSSRLCAALLFVAGIARTLAGSAQEVMHWSDFEICGDCHLQLIEVVRLGDEQGPGAITLANPPVSWDKDVGYLVTALTSIQVFGDDGHFLRAIGRRGEGPGEFQGIIDTKVVAGQIVTLDYATRAWSIFKRTGEFVGQRRYGFAVGPFVPVGGSRVVVISIDFSPNAVGHPFHLVDIDSGVPSLHFGWSGTWVIREFADAVYGSVLSRPGTIWWGTADSPRVQEWSVDDELLRVIEGELPWFPAVRRLIDPTREPPSTLLSSLALDREDHLWMSMRTADPEWQDVEVEPTGEEGAVIIPMDSWGDYLDTRLDVFDLKAGRHVGSYTWDSQNVRLMNLGGQPAVSVLEYTAAMVPQIVIYRIGWS